MRCGSASRRIVPITGPPGGAAESRSVSGAGFTFGALTVADSPSTRPHRHRSRSLRGRARALGTLAPGRAFCQTRRAWRATRRRLGWPPRLRLVSHSRGSASPRPRERALPSAPVASPPGTIAPSSDDGAELGLGPVQYSLGEKHGCAVVEDGTVACWGDGQWGQLGFTPDVNVCRGLRCEEPYVVPKLASVRAVTVAGPRSCAVMRDGTVRNVGVPTPCCREDWASRPVRPRPGSFRT